MVSCFCFIAAFEVTQSSFVTLQVTHGLSFRIYQITPGSAGNEITTWIPMSAKSEFSRQNNATFSFKYKDSYEKIKSNNYMWSLAGSTDRDPDAQHKRQLAAKNLVSFIGKRNSDVWSAKMALFELQPLSLQSI
jgi:maltoporin